MKTICYKFCDGTTSIVEISEELYTVCEELEKAERCNNKRETRRHVSLEYLGSNGIDFEDAGRDPLDIVISQSDKDAFFRQLAKILKPKQMWLFERRFVDGYSETEIAAIEKVSVSAICQRLKTIQKKVEGFFEKP